MLTKVERSYFYNTTTFSSEGGGESGGGGTAGGPSLSAEVMVRTEEEQEAKVEAECWAELRAVKERWMEEDGDGGVAEELERSKQSG